MSLSRWRDSLRIRLLAGTLVWIAASILLGGWGLSSLFRQHVATQFHGELQTHLDQLTAQLTLDAQGQPRLALPLSDPRLSRPYSGHYWQVDVIAEPDAGAPVAPGLLRSRSLWDAVLVVPQDRPADGQVHRHRLPGPEGKPLGLVERSVRIDDAANGRSRHLRLMVAADESLMDEPAERFAGVLWLALGLLASGLALAALVQVWVGLSPLRKLQTAIAQVRSGETQTLAGDFPVEIQPLIDEFNTVLAQNAEVVARARTQAGNLAHALKTPLSVLANAANEVEQAAGEVGKLGELGKLVSDQVGIARRQVDYHLARAQAAASIRLPGARTPLLPVIEGLVRVMRRIHAGRNIELKIEPIETSSCFRGEAQDLQEMLGNLLDNACKWARHEVGIGARVAGEQLEIVIDDDGKGLAAEQRQDVLRRGVRADELVQGSGLGLAIVDDLARLYGGQVELGDSPRGGLRAVLRLPAVF